MKLKWTKEKPREPGWYWRLVEGGECPYIFHYFEGVNVKSFTDGKWAGPIPEPE